MKSGKSRGQKGNEMATTKTKATVATATVASIEPDATPVKDTAKDTALKLQAKSKKFLSDVGAILFLELCDKETSVQVAREWLALENSNAKSVASIGDNCADVVTALALWCRRIAKAHEYVSNVTNADFDKVLKAITSGVKGNGLEAFSNANAETIVPEHLQLGSDSVSPNHSTPKTDTERLEALVTKLMVALRNEKVDFALRVAQVNKLQSVIKEVKQSRDTVEVAKQVALASIAKNNGKS